MPSVIDDDGDLRPAFITRPLRKNIAEGNDLPLIIRCDEGRAPMTSGDAPQILVAP